LGGAEGLVGETLGGEVDREGLALPSTIVPTCVPMGGGCCGAVKVWEAGCDGSEEVRVDAGLSDGSLDAIRTSRAVGGG